SCVCMPHAPARLRHCSLRNSDPPLVILAENRACSKQEIGAVVPSFKLAGQPANERPTKHLWAHVDELFLFLRQPELDATNRRAELAIRFGVILCMVWGGNRTWVGARA